MKFIYVLLLTSHLMLSAQTWLCLIGNASINSYVTHTCETAQEIEDIRELPEPSVIAAITHPPKNFTLHFSGHIHSHPTLFFIDVIIPPPKGL